MKKIKVIWSAASAEITLAAGAFFVVAATHRLSAVAAMYVIGFMLMALGLLIAKGRG